MKRHFLLICSVFALGSVSCNENRQTAAVETTQPAKPVTDSLVKRGEYSVKTLAANTTMTDEDVKAIYIYLKSIKPVNNAVPQPIAPDKM